MKVGFLGDTHGNLDAVKFMLWAMWKNDIHVVIQVGDFGIYTDNNGMKFASVVNELCRKYEIILIVVPGNHENWRVINELVGKNRTQYAPYRDHILLAPRGMRDHIGGMSFVFLGGAPSVDRMWRKKNDDYYDARGKIRANRHWYPEEQITEADVDYVVTDGYADVMVGHDAPHGIRTIEDRISGNPLGFHIADILYAEEGRTLYTKAFKGVGPRYLFHGHYHFPVDESIQRPNAEFGEETHVIGLHCELNNFSTAILDTETGGVYAVDHKKLLTTYRTGGATW